MPDRDENYTGYVAVPGEGVRFGVLSCLRCGAAVLIMPGEDNTKNHDEWHDFLTANMELPDLSGQWDEEPS